MAILVQKTVETTYKLPTSLKKPSFYLGCDPEFFVRRKGDGKIVGAEILLGNKDAQLNGTWSQNEKVIVDGVQLEINPAPTDCRANLANSIMSCMRALRQKLKGTDLTTDFAASVEISPEELNKLHEESRKFGCAPSTNSHTGTTSVIPVKGDEYFKRSAGGHIHIGIGKNYHKDPEAIKRLCYMMDLFVGIPGVLLDRDPGNIERRKVYGRAGEYRLPPHGFEYRTPSNFWLRGYPIMSLIFGLTKLASAIAIDSYNLDKTDDKVLASKGVLYLKNKGYDTTDLYQYIIDSIDIREVADIINNNDFKGAYRIWNTLEAILFNQAGLGAIYDTNYGIDKHRIEKFHYIIWKGLDELFPLNRDIVEYWANLPEGHGGGISEYYESVVIRDGIADEKGAIIEYAILSLMGIPYDKKK